MLLRRPYEAPGSTVGASGLSGGRPPRKLNSAQGGLSVPAGKNNNHPAQMPRARWRVIEVAWGWCGLQRGMVGLTRVSLPGSHAAAEGAVSAGAEEAESDSLLAAAAELLATYFDGKHLVCNLPLELEGMGAFSRDVLRACATIPWGSTRTYGELAAQVGSPRAARAVGQALGRNPLPVLVPCHRVIGADGGLVGFGGGVAFKRRLLEHEGICRTVP